MTEQQIERFSEALHRLSGDQQLLIMMAEICVADTPEVLAALAEHVEQGSAAEIVSTAHKLKGMCSTFETGSPVTELDELMQAAKKGKTQEVQAAFKNCRPQIDALFAEVMALTRA